MSWSDRYIGLPFADLGRSREGADCWGLACLVYAGELALTLPDYLGYVSAAERIEVAALVAGALRTPLWVPVTGPAAAFDIALFRRGGLTSHVGIVIRHGLMLHMARGDHARVEDYRAGRWGSRFVGHVRHIRRMTP